MTAASETSEYLTHLQKYNEKNGAVSITSDVRNDKGVLIAAKGDKLTNENVEKIVRHKLVRPIEECVGVEPILTRQLIKEDVLKLFKEYPDLEAIVSKGETMAALMPCLIYAEKFPIFIQKITIMSKTIESLYERTLMNALLALTLSLKLEVPKADIVKIFLISFGENIGYLHLNKNLSKYFTPPLELWREYYAHPLIAEKILQRIPGVPASVIRSVREHHERIDGSGFPSMISGDKISPYVTITGLVDELTRLRFSREDHSTMSIREAAFLLQFRQYQFQPTGYSALMSMIHGLKLPPSQSIKEDEMKVFAQTQILHYSKCLIYFDVIARITEASSASPKSKAIVKLNTLCTGFMQSVLASGMLSLPIRRLMEYAIEEPDVELIQDMVDIDLAHSGILDQLQEIFDTLEYIMDGNMISEEEKECDAYKSLSACSQYYKHLRYMEEQDNGLQLLIQQMEATEQDLEKIIATMRQVPK